MKAHMENKCHSEVHAFLMVSYSKQNLNSNNLQKISKTLVTECYLCLNQNESPSHLLLWCPKLKSFRNLLRPSLVFIEYSVPQSRMNCGYGMGSCLPSIRKNFSPIPLSTCQVTRKGRNQRVFKHSSTPFASIEDYCFRTLSFLCKDYRLLDDIDITIL